MILQDLVNKTGADLLLFSSRRRSCILFKAYDIIFDRVREITGELIGTFAFCSESQESPGRPQKHRIATKRTERNSAAKEVNKQVF